MLTPYRRLLSLPGAPGFVLPGFVGRLPMSMVGLGIVLLIQRQTGSYGLAGAVSATAAVMTSVVGPAISRLVDRHGQRRILLPTLAVMAAGLLALMVAASTGAPRWSLFAAAAVLGSAYPNLGSLVRARWTVLLGDPRQLQPALALESALDEVIFMVGPVLVTVLATQLHPLAGLSAALLLGVGGGLAFASRRDTEPPAHPRAGRSAVRAIRVPGVQVVTAVFVCTGAVFGAIDVSMVGFASAHGHRGLAGLLLALVASGSLLGGLAYGARQWAAPAPRRFVATLSLLAVAAVPLTLVTSLPVMALFATLAGLAIAPTLVTGFSLIERLVPVAALTEGFTWMTAGIGIGLAIGSPLAGHLIDAVGPNPAFLVCVVAAALAAGVAAAGRRRLQPAAG